MEAYRFPTIIHQLSYNISSFGYPGVFSAGLTHLCIGSPLLSFSVTWIIVLLLVAMLYIVLNCGEFIFDVEISSAAILSNSQNRRNDRSSMPDLWGFKESILFTKKKPWTFGMNLRQKCNALLSDQTRLASLQWK